MKNKLVLLLAVTALNVFSCIKNDDSAQPGLDAAITRVMFEPLSLVEAQTKARKQNKSVLIDFFSPT